MSESDTLEYDLVVIGGGPAGQSACIALEGRLKRIAVVDEQPRPGGQILRQPPEAFTVRGWMKGRGYSRLKSQLARFEALEDVKWIGGASVAGIAESDAGWRVVIASGGETRTLSARRVLIAAGCYDMAMPAPGWTLPGVMAAGGVQAFIKSQRLLPGRRIALVGSHPLQLLVADQISEAGGEVALIAFSQPFGRALRTILSRPAAWLSNPGRVLEVAGLLLRVWRSSARVRFGVRSWAIRGEQRVEALRWGDGQEIGCDVVALCFGFLPQSDLPRSAGLKMEPCEGGGWGVRHDEWMRASRPGVYAAGETTGVDGADAASAEGLIAGLGIALDAGVIGIGQARRESRVVRRARQRAKRFAGLLTALAVAGHPDLKTLPEDTLICRCEDVDLGAVSTSVARCADLNAIKLATRCGMGVCQGRNCEHTLLRLVAEVGGNLHTGLEGFTARFPARPVRIGDLLNFR